MPKYLKSPTGPSGVLAFWKRHQPTNLIPQPSLFTRHQRYYSTHHWCQAGTFRGSHCQIQQSRDGLQLCGGQPQVIKASRTVGSGPLCRSGPTSRGPFGLEIPNKLTNICASWWLNNPFSFPCAYYGWSFTPCI